VTVSAEDEMSTPRKIQALVPQGSILFPMLHSTYLNDTPQTPVVYLALFADDVCYVIDHKENNVLRKLQQSLNSVVA
jgi:hypothetical protein